MTNPVHIILGWGSAAAVSTSGAVPLLAQGDEAVLSPATLVPLGAVLAGVAGMIVLAFKAGRWQQQVNDTEAGRQKNAADIQTLKIVQEDLKSRVVIMERMFTILQATGKVPSGVIGDRE